MSQVNIEIPDDYKDLGWQNAWHCVYLDEDGNETTGGEGKKPKKYFDYLERDHPEYGKCQRLKHKRRTASNGSGSENVVVCDTCKIVWRYDCSG